MTYKKQTTTEQGSKIEIIIRRLKELATTVEITPDSVNIKFPTLEGAIVFNRMHGSELGRYYAGRKIRWTGQEWKNKPECLETQESVLAGLLKWGPDKKYSRIDQARARCKCYSCDRPSLRNS